jgi:ABC-2 type transport system ATP-binding protein
VENSYGPLTPAIAVDSLVKVYRRRGKPDVRAVDGLSFDVARGSIFGLLGPNGAGKSTTLRILTTLTQPTSGAARVLGRDVIGEAGAVRDQIAVVIQDTAVDLFLTVRDNLVTYARFRGITGADARRRCGEVMERFGLTAEASRKVMDLSGGFKRRVQVAKTFLVDTPVVFLDEFSTGMDPLLKRSVMDLLRQERDRGRTIVLTTQILSEAESLCDDILIVNEGREIARGDLHTLKGLSQGVYEVSIAFEDLPDGLVAELEARSPLRLAVSGTTIEVALREPEADVLALVAAMLARGRVVRLEVGGASLEDIFVELLQKRPA